MEHQAILSNVFAADFARDVKFEEEDDEFRSCCGEEEVWKETEELAKEVAKQELDEFSVKMSFKGISLAWDSSNGLCGIGVFMERSADLPVIQVQKRLEFGMGESVADYLALMEGLVEAVQNNIQRVYAFTDSELLFDQIIHQERLDSPLLIALRERILEHASKLEVFVLKLVPSADLERSSRLAQIAIGIISFPIEGGESIEKCSICCEDKPSPVMISMKCSHKFCSHCMRTYVDEKVQTSQVPVRCPQMRCTYYISTTECSSFLPLASYESFVRALAESDLLNSDRLYCPYPNCSVLFDPCEYLSARASSSSQSDNRCIECPACQRFICGECGVPWHSSINCEEYQNLSLEERDSSDITLHRMAQNNGWQSCPQCRRMIELTQGCNHMTCRCGHEFCYSCGSDYVDGQHTCQCAFWDGENSTNVLNHSVQESERWAWETFNSLPMIMDAYSDQERSQLALIQRFLAGGFSLSDHHPYQPQSPPRCTDSYMDAMKDIHQLPWLERFVSVISDEYYEDYIQ